MSRIRGINTKPEVQLRKALWALGLRYRTKSKLPGRPDLIFAGRKVVLFVDGCFWHACPRHLVFPKQNGVFWRDKLQENVARDQRVNRELRKLGWHVVRVWEHDIRIDLEKTALRQSKKIRSLGEMSNGPGRGNISR